MKDLQEIWQQPVPDSSELSKMLSSKAFLYSKEPGPLARLKKNLVIHLVYAVVITLGYLAILFYFHYWQVQACIGLLVIFNAWAMYKAYRLYAGIELDLTQQNVLSELKKHYNTFSEWQRQSLRIAILVYPFAAAGGFMLGGAVGAGKPPEVLFEKPFFSIALVISIIVLVPLSYLLARWMTKVAFGKFVDQLKVRIDELESET